MIDDGQSPGALRAEVNALRARVDELIKSEARLREDLRRAQRMIERIPIVLYIYDIAERRNVFSNRDFSDILGYSPEEAARLGPDILSALAHPDDRDALLSHHITRMSAAKDGEVVELTYRMRDARGEERWLNCRHTVLERGADNEPTQLLGTVKDITDLKQAEVDVTRISEEMRASSDDLHTFKSFVVNARDGIGLANSSGVVVYANPAFKELMGFGEALVGTPISATLEPEQNERFQNEIYPALMHQGRFEGIIPHKRPDGSEWLAQFNAFTILKESGKEVYIAALVRDVTAQIKAEQERAALQAQLIEAQREALREIGTPLIPIADGLVAMPLIGVIDADRAKQMLEVLLNGIVAQRAAAAILDITGVKAVDAQVADALVRAAKAARLLGAEVVLTGVGPALAQALIEVGAELGGVVVRGSFQSGIAYALGRISGARDPEKATR
jgi:PAS domain S-box-containing protein